MKTKLPEKLETRLDSRGEIMSASDWNLHQKINEILDYLQDTQTEGGEDKPLLPENISQEEFEKVTTYLKSIGFELIPKKPAFTFPQPEQSNYVDSRTPEERERDSKVTSTLTSTEPERQDEIQEDTTSMEEKMEALVQQPVTEDWEKEFMDFYFEKGKYTRRPLGPQEYIQFISSVRTAAVEEERERVAEKIANHTVDLCKNSQEFKQYVFSLLTPEQK